MLRDLTYSLRLFRRNLAFTATVIFTLALGMGATTAVFTVVNGVLFRPLPYPQPDRLVSISIRLQGERESNPFSYVRDFAAWRQYNRTLSQLAGYLRLYANFAGHGETEWVAACHVTASLFPMLGAHPVLGRVFRRGEDRPGAPPVAILDNAFWKRRLGGDPSVIGKSIVLDNQTYTVVGVLPPGFLVPDRYAGRTGYDVWLPFVISDAGQSKEILLQAIGRLAPGVTLAAARGDLETLMHTQWRRGPKREAVVVPWHDRITGGARRSLLVFLGAVACVLLIVCVNVANLLLSRAAAREKEVAVRCALGARRTRVIRQFLVESTLLGLMGGMLGLVFAWWLKDLLLLWIQPQMPALAPIAFDYRVLLFAVALGLLTGVIFGLAPAWTASGIELHDALKESGRGVGEGHASSRFGSLLAVVEIALATLLVSAAGLLLNSFVRLSTQDLGFRTGHILSFQASLPETRYPKHAGQARFLEQALDRVQNTPGVESAAGGEWLPLTGGSMTFEPVLEARPGSGGQASGASVSPGYFRTLGIPILRGRAFTAADREGAPPVVIVNQSFVRRFLPGQNPLGVRLENPNRDKEWATIVGVAGDVHDSPGQDITPEVYVSSLQPGDPNMTSAGGAYLTLLVRAPGDPRKLVPALRAQVAAIDPTIPLHDVAMLDDLRAQSITPHRVTALLIAVFATLALALGCIGIYGVMAYSVGRRTHEIGVRMALGAQHAQILGMVLRHGLALIAAGLCLGLLASLGATRWLSSELWGVSAGDPLTLALAAVLLAACGLAACVVPARRAAKVDPMVALRCE